MIIIPPTIVRGFGYSEKTGIAIIAATTGSKSFDADTKDGEKYLRHQLKIL